MAFTFQRENFDPATMALAKFFADMGNRQREDQYAQQEAQAKSEEQRRREAAAMAQKLLELGMGDKADQIAQEYGLMTPPGGYAGVQADLSARDAAAAAEKEAAARMAAETEQRDLMGLTDPTSPSVFGTMTDESAGMPGIAAPRTNVWQEETGISPAQAKVFAAIRYKLTPEQLTAFDQNIADGASPGDALKSVRANIGLAQTADQKRKSDIDQSQADTQRYSAETSRRQFELENKKYADGKAAVEAAAASGKITGDEFDVAMKITDRGDKQLGKLYENVAAANAMKVALDSRDYTAAYGAIVTFLKSLDDSVAREGEVKTLIDSMGGIPNLQQRAETFLNGKATERTKNELKKLLTVVTEKNNKLIGSREAAIDVLASRSGPGVKSVWDDYKTSLRGGSGGAEPPTSGDGTYVKNGKTYGTGF